ncbi:MAG TPA: hypothetical protein VJZ52_01405, partial [Candidatus Paceibacterota bacterium]|nr:hypothetical protein [Candidatus Paceibacterota bacterium]
MQSDYQKTVKSLKQSGSTQRQYRHWDAMLQPKRIKHRKVHVGRLKTKTARGAYLSFGSYG